MIDFNKLNEAYDSGGFYALQLEVVDVCRQNCSYCYMNALPESKNRLTDQMISDILHSSEELGITAIEWLGGEPLLRSSIFDHMTLARQLGFRNNLWTGGLPLENDEVQNRVVDLCSNGLISVHLSTLNRELYEKLHPGRSAHDIDIIVNAIEKMLDSGYPNGRILNSVTYTGYQTAEDMIGTMKFFNENFGIITSINVYHTYLRPGQSDLDLERFIPSKNEVSRVYRYFGELTGQKQMPLNCVNKQYCSATLAVLNDGSVTPCATIRPADAPKTSGDNFFDVVNRNRDELIFNLFRDQANLPDGCATCNLNESCWGCRSRSFAAGNGIYGKDPRCFRS